MDFEVVVEELRACDRAATSAAAQARRLSPDDALVGAVVGIPGADAALLMHQVGDRWRQQFAVWSARMEGYGEKLDVSARSYQRGDDVSGTAFADLGGDVP
ncbi:hypothetical protein ACIB24_22455 [Spongisporangium articulatum]|uniref:Excreted virulence factor EspC, type VII ESX diderm n=1 Tax=Spongisporangium articulatum TaxID=3362603 RepID=A0ABW8ATY8_9ACTN